ncbi:CHAT domain-containing tetratricopeptide repeat protein [Bradyrhizobium sp. CCBAU 53421]|uniref:CHAT domain-containing protein n=1 Tax=Bradyrhizobium sp. CCBAU 53421 TaxID=1325120 RepID=UPI00188BB490|nr:CHAT domain-containing tetratricopeptide repeat protein [Bradyrhizobium sp. CCBAU 53421]QOZ33268.1 hypothetical protein XH92_17645 [Bradyrhizobium sp. CCBAU 53421]
MTSKPAAGDDSEGETDNFLRMIELTHAGRAALARGEARSAIELLSEQHKLVVAEWGSDAIFSATSAVDLAEAYLACGDTPEAERLLEWALDRYQTLGVEDERFVRALSSHAMCAYLAADYPRAESRFIDLIERYRTLGTERDVERAMAMDHLAQAYVRQSNFEAAEPLLLEALAIFESQNVEASIVAICQGVLARVRFLTARYREAEQLQRKAIASYEACHDELNLAKELDHLGATLTMRAQSEEQPVLAQEAVTYGERAVAIFEKYYPANHYSVLGSKQNLARYQAANASIGKMFPNRTTSDGPEPHLPKGHPAVIAALANRSQQLCDNHDYESALAAADQARQHAQVFGRAGALDRLAFKQLIAVLRRYCSYLIGEPTGLLSPIESFMMQMRAHERRGIVEDEKTPLPAIEPATIAKLKNLLNEAVRLVGEACGFEWSAGDEPHEFASDLLEILHYARLVGVIDNDASVRQAFDVIQIYSYHGAAQGLASAAMQAVETGARRLLREEHRLAVLERDSLVRALIEAKDRTSASSAAARSAELPGLEQKIAAIELQLRDGHGLHERLFASRIPLEVAQVSLNSNEALVAVYVGTRAVFLVAARNSSIVFRRVEIEGGLVRSMCESIVKSATFSPGEDAPKFDLVAALRLNDLIFYPLRQFLDADFHLLLLTNGPLLALPMGCLVADSIQETENQTSAEQDSESAGTFGKDLEARFHERIRRLHGFHRWVNSRTIEEAQSAISARHGWLADRYRISLMPSFAPLATRSVEGNATIRRRAFLGMGDPALGSKQDARYPEMPETRRMLMALANAVGSDPVSDIFSGAAATIERLVELSESGQLAARSVVCFATHAVYPQDDDDLLADAGLLFADGEILQAFDVGNLRLDADLVLLPACFTASPAGRSITVPLSGLAQAFLVAGGRRLLVSHWPVEVGATERFIRTFAAAMKGSAQLVDALAQAQQQLRDSKEYAHPAFWAGFSLVGDGAAKLASN